MLDVADIEVRYGKMPAVRGVSLQVVKGEIVCLVGPNGAGKSTILKAVMGEIPLYKGVVRFGGRALLGMPVETIVREGLSMVPEGRGIFTRLTVEENLKLATFVCTDRSDSERNLAALFEQFPILKDRRSWPAGRLSGGEQQQLAIARSMLTRPRLLLVDEPTLGLAPLLVEHIYETLCSLREKGVTLLVVEQSLQRALDIADRVYILRGGLIHFSGSTREIADTADLERAYFGFANNNGG